MKAIRRPKKHSLAWWKRQRRQREKTRALAAIADKWSPPALSKESARELDEVLRDLGGESG